MVWLRKTPKRPASVKNALIEIREAIKSLKARRDSVYNNEVSLEYPRQSRVDIYERQLESLSNTLYLINKSIEEIEHYPTKEVNLF